VARFDRDWQVHHPLWRILSPGQGGLAQCLRFSRWNWAGTGRDYSESHRVDGIYSDQP